MNQLKAFVSQGVFRDYKSCTLYSILGVFICLLGFEFLWKEVKEGKGNKSKYAQEDK